MKLYNSLTKTKEEMTTYNENRVEIYTCGPTVYDYVTIGNWRTYFLGDVLVRSLAFLGYQVDYLMNITDVGHLTGDNLGDADTGEDRMEKSAKKLGKTAWDVADFYTKDFLSGFDAMNMVKPIKFMKATAYIEEQINLVKMILKAGFGYAISDGIYFDVSEYEKEGNVYGELSNIDRIKEGARVEPNPEKKDPRDFALWKFSGQEEGRQMEWQFKIPLYKCPLYSTVKIEEYKVGVVEINNKKVIVGWGFPGWHVECSAMSMSYFGEQFDIHVGGEDLKSTHHPNEIAQSEAATGVKPFVHYWLHGAFLKVDGGRMGKSLGNAYNLSDLKARGYKPEHLRYFYLSGHYRKPLNFSFETLDTAKSVYEKLTSIVLDLKSQTKKLLINTQSKYFKDFIAALEDDLNMPEALAVLWVVVKSDLPANEKLAHILEFDMIFGLRLADAVPTESLVPNEIVGLLKTRDEFRAQKDFAGADRVRDEIEALGYDVIDASGGSKVRKK